MNNILRGIREFVGFTDPVDELEEYGDPQGKTDYASPYESRRGVASPEMLEPEDAGAAEVAAPERRRRSGEWTGEGRRSVRERAVGNTMGNNVIGLPNVNQSTSEVVVMEPHRYEEMAEVIRHLRERKTVIMNLTLMDPVDAQRSVDFVAGGTYAIDGHQERIGENIFLFTPSCVSVTTPSAVTQAPATQRSTQIPTPIWSTTAAGYGDMPMAAQR